MSRVAILTAQWKFAEALQLADKIKQDSPQEADALDVLRGRIYHFVGDKEQARKLFAALGDKIKPGNEYAWFDKLVEVEFRLGLKEEAFDHCARALAVTAAPYAQRAC